MRNLIFILCWILIGGQGYSQSVQKVKGNKKFGLRAAVNYSGLTGSKNYTSYPTGIIYSIGPYNQSPFQIKGFSAGVFAEITFSDEITVSPELDYSLKGNNYNINGVLNGKPYDIALNVNLNYITVPFFIKYHPAVLQGINLFAGPELGWLISASQVVTGDLDAGKTSLNSQFTKMDAGLCFGLDYYFGKNFGLDIRYFMGFANVAPPEENTYVHNRTFQAGVKYRFGDY